MTATAKTIGDFTSSPTRRSSHQDAIVVEGLSYSYGSKNAVKNIRFSVGAGEVLGFLGPNGAGKSTTLKMLTGQLRPAAGRALLLGHDVAKEPERVKAQIGVAFETANLYEGMSASENLDFFAQLFGVKGFDAKALLARVGLEGRGSERVAGYSKGMKQRLMLARALVNRPRVLFLDEPTDGLDPVSTGTIHTLVQEETARGATVILTTHNMHEADKLADRVAFINHGEIVALDTPHALKQQYGARLLKIEVEREEGKLETRTLTLDTPDTAAQLSALLTHERVVTLHSQEATLEDIFVRITGRGLL